MINPFKYGGLVTGKDFADRESEMNEIVREIRSGTNIVLFSPRRMGKSSLLAELMHRHGGEFLFVYVDLYGITTKTRMVEAFMESVLRRPSNSLGGGRKQFARPSVKTYILCGKLIYL